MGMKPTAAKAWVILASDNGRSLMLSFDNPPLFCSGVLHDGMIGVNIDTGQVTMMLTRGEIDGRPGGPWVEPTSGGHYEVDEVAPN